MTQQNASIITKIEGKAIPVPGNDIDTDRIIPARFMKCVTFDGLGEYAFYDERFDADGSQKDHPFNDPKYNGGSILIVGSNFGCGSSREHAPQALLRFGIQGIIGVSFADIFAGNCTSLGIPAVMVNVNDNAKLIKQIEETPETMVTIDLAGDQVIAGDQRLPASMNPSSKTMLTEGLWDTTSLLIASKDDIQTKAETLPYLNGF